MRKQVQDQSLWQDHFLHITNGEIINGKTNLNGMDKALL